MRCALLVAIVLAATEASAHVQIDCRATLNPIIM